MREPAPCHICGTVTELSFEHVPPERAFNDRPVVNPTFQRMLAMKDIDELDSLGGRTSQRGAGAYTLCGPCNNFTGGAYGKAYVEWAYEGIYALDHARQAPSVAHIFRGFPLRIIKQIMSMFCSANPPGFAKLHPDLIRFILNVHHKHMPHGLRVFAGLNDSPRSRQASMTARIDTAEGRTALYSEIAYPPFVYLLTEGQPAPDPRLVEITYFSQYGHMEWRDIVERFSILPIDSFLPGDYRSRPEMRVEPQQP